MIDLLIKGGTIITVDKAGMIIKHGYCLQAVFKSAMKEMPLTTAAKGSVNVSKVNLYKV